MDSDNATANQSDNATANRMGLQAAETASPVVQEIVDELATTHEGGDVEEVADAVQEKWTEKFGDEVAPIPEDAAAEIAEHIAAGNEVTIVPPEP